MERWRRTLYTVWFTQFVAMVGFSFVSPFIPYYIQELGVTGVSEVALLSGLATSIMAITMAFAGPIWGAVSDRHGRKIMVMRATFAGAIILALMGIVTNVQQLLFLRFLQGALTGTVTATTTLVVSGTPPDRRGMALGSLQTAISLGVSLGPIIGGLAGERFGYRTSFLITALLLATAAVSVTLFVHEDFRPAPQSARMRRLGLTQGLAIVFSAGGALLAVFATRIVLRMGTQLVFPVLPLFVQSLLPAAAGAATTTGLVFAAGTFGQALGSPVLGAWGDRWGHRRVLVLSSLAAALLYIPQAFVPSAQWLIVWQMLAGFGIGGTLSTLSSLLAAVTPEGHEGVVFGLDGSAVSLAAAIGPMLGAGVAAAVGLRAPFLVAALLFGLAVAVAIIGIQERQASPAEQVAARR